MYSMCNLRRARYFYFKTRWNSHRLFLLFKAHVHFYYFKTACFYYIKLHLTTYVDMARSSRVSPMVGALRRATLPRFGWPERLSTDARNFVPGVNKNAGSKSAVTRRPTGGRHPMRWRQACDSSTGRAHSSGRAPSSKLSAGATQACSTPSSHHPEDNTAGSRQHHSKRTRASPGRLVSVARAPLRPAPPSFAVDASKTSSSLRRAA